MSIFDLKFVHLWRRKRRQMRWQREMAKRVESNLAAKMGAFSAEVVANLESARREGRFPYAPKDPGQ